MNGILTFLALLVCGGVLAVEPTLGASALLVCAVVSGLAGLAIARTGADKTFLLRLFIGALLIRILIGTIIFAFSLQGFFGGDAFTYDGFGYFLLKTWQGDNYYQSLVNQFVGETGSSAWGMLYMVAIVYGAIGRNMLAIQFINAALGAATAPIIFLCAQHVFNNRKAALYAACFTAFYPSLVLWSSQGLKDGPIVFFLALSMLATLKLGEKLNLKYLIVLTSALFAIFSLRFYVFYMVLAAIAGAFIIGMHTVSARSLVRQLVVAVVIAMSLTYFGVTRYANLQVERMGNFETLQRSRLDQAQSAKSGFVADADVSTTSGALSVLPLGLIYLWFAPFPWELASLRQSITLPEMIVWWLSIPFLVLGLWFTIRYRLRQISPILFFSSMLTLAYALFQGNVGTAYRQRSQLLVFYFIFVAVGLVLLMEKREAKKHQRLLERQQIAGKQAASLPHRAASRPHVWKDENEEVAIAEEKAEESRSGQVKT